MRRNERDDLPHASMTTRRTFLQTSLLAAGAPFVTGLALRSRASMAGTRVVTERDCANACRFAASFGERADSLPADPMDYLPAFEEALACERYGTVFGLTRDSSQFLLTQTAARYGYRVTYCGRHDARSGTFVHTLQGDRSTVSALASELDSGRAAWADVLAIHVPELVHSTSSKLRRAVDTDSVRATGCLPYLTSWTLRRV